MDVRQTLVDLGCVLEGEFFFALKSSRVATKYINIDPLLTEPAILNAIAREMAKRKSYSSLFGPADVVAGPAVGAIPLVYAVANEYKALGELGFADNIWMKTVFAEKSGGSFVLDRFGFENTVRGKRVWIVEDIAATGDSAKGTAAAIEAAGGIIIGYSFIWNRGEIYEDEMGAPVLSLVKEFVPSWDTDLSRHPHWGEWPLVTDIGHPGNFPDYSGPRIALL
jgi:orotate phosphoribosyltransferase